MDEVVTWAYRPPAPSVDGPSLVKVFLISIGFLVTCFRDAKVLVLGSPLFTGSFKCANKFITIFLYLAFQQPFAVLKFFLPVFSFQPITKCRPVKLPLFPAFLEFRLAKIFSV